MRKPPAKPFAKGNKLGGRPKGVKNKFTTLKEAFVNALQEVGGEEYIIKFAKGSSQERIAFMKSIASMLPRDMQVTGAEGQPIIPPTININFVKSEGQK